MTAFVGVEVHDSIATIWLRRPDKRNAMNYAMWRALGEACAALGADPAVRVVVLRGAGGNFCAGADIADIYADRAPGEASFMDVNAAAETALATLPKPTIAMVEGDCVGGGCALAIDCDLRVAASTARFGITPARLGIVYPVSSIERAVRQLGPATAKYLLFSGALINADHALRVGLVDEVHDAAAIETRTYSFAAELAERSLLTQVSAKQMVASIMSAGAVGAEVRDRWEAAMSDASDPREGTSAFLERRPARFNWVPPIDS